MSSDYADLKAETLKTFFKTNDQIQYVVLQFSLYHNPNKHRISECIKTTSFAANLHYLFVSIDKELADCFNDICNHLNMLCGRENFKSLSIKFAGAKSAKCLKSHARQLATWKQLEEEVQIEDDRKQLEGAQIEDDFSTYAMLLVRSWKNLKRIRCDNRNPYHTTSFFVRHSTFNITELNRAREKLRNACELTIFTNCIGNVTNLNHKLVKLKLVKFQSPYWEVDPNFV